LLTFENAPFFCVYPAYDSPVEVCFVCATIDYRFLCGTIAYLTWINDRCIRWRTQRAAWPWC